MAFAAKTACPAPLCESADVNPRALHILALALVLIATALTSCHCASDGERAAKERAEIDKRARDSLVLFPYRTVKAMIRSTGSPDRPPVFDELDKALAAAQALPETAQDLEADARALATWGNLFVQLVKTRETLKDKDEDAFPTLLEVWTSEKPFIAWYDNPLEHAWLAVFWLVADIAGEKGHLPTADIIFYELSRAKSAPAWPFEARAFANLARGVTFSKHAYRYAAEEELNIYLHDVSTESVSPLVLRGLLLDAAGTRAALSAAGYFARAYNRFGLGRDDPATDDVEAGLKELEKLKVDSELTWWAWAIVHAKRERFEESAKYLDRLAGSPNMDERTKQEIASAAAEMRAGKRVPLVKQAWAGKVLVQAIIARAGGVENMLAVLAGKDEAARILSPLTFLDRARQGLSRAADPARVTSAAKDTAKTVVDELGAKGRELLKK